MEKKTVLLLLALIVVVIITFSFGYTLGFSDAKFEGNDLLVDFGEGHETITCTDLCQIINNQTITKCQTKN